MFQLSLGSADEGEDEEDEGDGYADGEDNGDEEGDEGGDENEGEEPPVLPEFVSRRANASFLILSPRKDEGDPKIKQPLSLSVEEGKEGSNAHMQGD